VGLLLTILFSSIQGCQKKCRDYWISPTGNDSNNGDFNNPFLTLERARNAVRSNSNKGACTIYVNLKQGTYRLNSPFILNGQDSGKDSGSIVYRSAPGEKVEILGSEQVTDWTLHDAGSNIWKAQTHVNTTLMPRQLYVNGTRAVRARTPDYPFLYVPTTTGYSFNDPLGLYPEAPPTWKNPTAVEAVTVTQWKMMRCPIAEVITQEIIPMIDINYEVHMVQPCWNNVNVFPSPWNFHLLSWWENAYEFLTEPGEWYLDPTTKILYYIPREDEELNNIAVELPVLETLIQGQGTLKNPVSYIEFTGLNFMYATWLEPSSSDGYALDQSGFHLIGPNHKPNTIGHDPNSVRTPGNLSFTYAQNISFIDNTFSHMGAVGLDFGTGSQGNNIENNQFNDISSAAIQLGGIAPEDHHPKHPEQLTTDNRIINNKIQYTGQEYYDAPGIYIGFTTRSLLKYNDIQHTSWSGIAIGWGWGLLDPGGFPGLPHAVPYEWGVYNTPSASHQNRITHNKIQYFLEKLWDGGAIYNNGFQGTSLQDGLFIEKNIAQNKRPNAGGNTFYTDGGSRYITVRNNVSLDNPRGFLDFGPCTTLSLIEKFCLSTDIVPYGADMGGCVSYGDMRFEGNYLRDAYNFFGTQLCMNANVPNFPTNMNFINNEVISELSDIPPWILSSIESRN